MDSKKELVKQVRPWVKKAGVFTFATFGYLAFRTFVMMPRSRKVVQFDIEKF